MKHFLQKIADNIVNAVRNAETMEQAIQMYSFGLQFEDFCNFLKIELS